MNEKKETNGLEASMKKLSKELEQRYAAQSTVKREGNTLVVPEFMTYRDAANAIVAYETEMDKVENKIIKVNGHVNDMLVALYHAMVSTFGHAVGNTIESFFGSTPGAISVPIGYDETLTVPFGDVSIPGLPVKFTVATGGQGMEGVLQVVATCKRKFMPLVEEIENALREELKHNSIFRKKAIDSQFNFLNLHGFDMSRIVHSVQEGLDLNANILQFIRHTEEARKAKLNLKRTILLHGKYGTGKTLTALAIAKTAQLHEWTFINVLPGDDITNALKFAQKYQPCVVFFEDIDQVTDGERNTQVNNILNTIDGILSKNAEVITVLTTNHVENVERAMLRPGRIDALIELGKIDEQALGSLILATVGDHVGGINPADLMETVKGYTPAFIVEGCQRALLYAMAEGRKTITQDDLKFSLNGLRSQYELMMSERESVRKDSLDEKFRNIIREAC